MGVRLLDEDLDMVVAGELDGTTQALLGARRFQSSDRRFCVMLGPPGVGKTIAGVWLAMQPAVEAVDHWLERLDRSDEPLRDLQRARLHIPPCEWVSAPDVATRWTRWRGDVEALPLIYRDAEVLIVDDLGTESTTDRWQESFGQLIDYRQTVGRTVLNANLEKSDIRKRYGDRVADRLNHTGVAMRLPGPSRRRQGAGL